MNMIEKARARQRVRELQPYVCARDLYKQAEIFMDANENAFGSVIDFREMALNRYPDSDSTALRKELANYLGSGVSSGNILVGNGSDEIIDMAIRAFAEKGDNIVCVQPGYSMFEVCAAVSGVEVRKVLVERDLQPNVGKVLAAVDARTRMIVLVSPNSPLGNVIDTGRIAEIAERAPCIVLVDEAYGEFAGVSLSPRVLQTPNLAVSKTLSKAWGLAALRIGYLVADKAVISDLRRIKLPYNLSGVSEMLAVKALAEGRPKMEKYVWMMRREKEILEAALKGLRLQVFPTDTNFCVFRMPPRIKSKEVQEAIAKKGIIVRDRSSMPMMENCIRVTVGKTKENRRFLEALGEVLAK